MQMDSARLALAALARPSAALRHMRGINSAAFAFARPSAVLRHTRGINSPAFGRSRGPPAPRPASAARARGISSSLTFIRNWMISTGPPTNLVHMIVVTCQTASIVIATTTYVLNQRAEGERREDQETLAALDRCACFALNADRVVLDLEQYKHDIQVRERRRSRLAWLLGGPSEPRPWAEVWLDERNAFELRARRMEALRAGTKNLWFIAKQAWERHPARRDARIVKDFFFDAPLNAALAQRCLRLCEDMDEARLRRRGLPYGDANRPAIYPFMEEAYGIDRRSPLKQDAYYAI